MINFDELIDNYLTKSFRTKQVGRYYPSEIGGCMRKTWFSYKNPKPVSTKLARIFEMGNRVHDFVVDVLKSKKNQSIELLGTEMPIKIEEPEFIISGRIDNLVLVKINNNRYLIEVKSCKFLPDTPHESHKMQLQLYMYGTKVYRGIILYLQKDKLETRWFNIEYDKTIAENILRRFRTLHNYLSINKIPSAEAKINPDKKWLCNNCEYKEECDKL